MKKQYTVEISRMNKENKYYTGTVEELVQRYFSYVLLKGSSWDSRVNRNPKTIASLLTNLNRAAYASTTHYQTEYYRLAEESK